MATSAALSAVLTGVAALRSPTAAGSASSSRDARLDWDIKKREVLAEFTLTGKLSVAASFLLDESEEDGSGLDSEGLPLAKARARLEALEAAARGGASVEMTQAEYERRITRLSRDLTRAWNGNQRVTSLKIAIQCSKLLTDARVPAFYPSVFVLVTDILDTFGRLVFERLRSSAVEELERMGGAKGGQLPVDFASGDVGAEARETCRNWIYKTACIRELLPRLYVEMALLECYRFLHATADFAPIILRLSHSIRGIGNPLVAVYARWYLARQAARLVLNPERLRETLFTTATDYLYTFHEIASGARSGSSGSSGSGASASPGGGAGSPGAGAGSAASEVSGVPMPLYLRLHSPPVAWLLALVGAGASKEVFQAVLVSYRDCCGNAMVLRHIIDGFDGSFWSSHLSGMLQLVKDAKPGDAPMSAEGAGAGGAASSAADAAAAVAAGGAAELYRAMASAMVAAPPPVAQRIPFLNEAWKAITRVGDPVTFSRHAASLVELLTVAYTEREVLLLLGDLCKRLTAAAAAAAAAATAAGGGVGGSSGGGGGAATRAPPAALPHLQRLLTVLVEAEVRRLSAPGSSSAFGGVLTSEFFARLLDMFHSEARPSLCRRLLGALVQVPCKISDAVVINT
jgi:hypothetical protein